MADWEEHGGYGYYGDDCGGQRCLNGGEGGVEDPPEKNAWNLSNP